MAGTIDPKKLAAHISQFGPSPDVDGVTLEAIARTYSGLADITFGAAELQVLGAAREHYKNELYPVKEYLVPDQGQKDQLELLAAKLREAGDDPEVVSVAFFEYMKYGAEKPDPEPEGAKPDPERLKLFYTAVTGGERGPRIATLIQAFGIEGVIQKVEEAVQRQEKAAEVKLMLPVPTPAGFNYDEALPGWLHSKKDNKDRSRDVLTIARSQVLPDALKDDLVELLNANGYQVTRDDFDNREHLSVPRYAEVGERSVKDDRILSLIAQKIEEHDVFTDMDQVRHHRFADEARGRRKIATKPLNFEEIDARAKAFADYLDENRDKVASALNSYETWDTAQDEIDRALDLLRNLDKNREFFEKEAGPVTSFLPLNQPIYATVCFGVVPSLMCEEVHVRPPTAVHPKFKELTKILDFEKEFPNLHISYQDREEFVKSRKDVTQTVIFTGNPKSAKDVRNAFPKECLFILNGAGHNPLVVTESADIEKAVESTLRTALQNQGQDCAAPNTILVHKDKLPEYKALLLEKLKEIEEQGRVGNSYADQKVTVGPNSDIDHATNIAQLMGDNRQYFIHGGEINIATGLIKPAVFEKPLAKGGNYEEAFAPLIFVQEYENDAALAQYFEDKEGRYKKNAMYVSVFGEPDAETASPYVASLIAKGMHTKGNIYHNTDLHAAEHGYDPYGGLGVDASSASADYLTRPGATLPQRDIWLYAVKGERFVDKPFEETEQGFFKYVNRAGAGADFGIR